MLTRAYICRRGLSYFPFTFDYLAHSALLFDARTLDEIEKTSETPGLTRPPVTSFLFERLEDHEDPETGLHQPYFGM